MIYANGTRLCRRSGLRFRGCGPECRVRAHGGRGSGWGSVDPCAVCFCRCAIGGGAERYDGGGAEGRRRKRERKRVKNLSEGKGKCINDPVAAGLTGLHGYGWANGYYTATCAKKKSLGYVTLSCGEVCWRAEVLRYASPKAS